MKIGQVIQTLKGHIHSNSKLLTLAVVLPRTAVCWSMMENSVSCSLLKFLHLKMHIPLKWSIYTKALIITSKNTFKLLTQEFKFYKLLASS